MRGVGEGHILSARGRSFASADGVLRISDYGYPWTQQPAHQRDLH